MATLLAVRSHRRRTLTPSGSVAAFAVGYGALANPTPAFGTCLLVFFFAGTFATKYKREVKAKLVREGRLVKENVEEQKGRDWKQVLSNSWLGTLCAIAHRARAANALPAPLAALNDWPETVFTFGAVAFWGACCGDTVRSHLLV